MMEEDVSTLTMAPAPRYSLIWLGVLAGVGFYFVDALVDAMLFNEGILRDQLLHPSGPELWVRTCVLLMAMTFAIFAQQLLNRERATSERARTAETFLSSVVDNIPNMVFIKDAGELRFIRVNHAAESLLGLKSRELIGRNDHDFFPERQAEFFTRKDREVLDSGIEIDIPEEEIDTVVLGKRWLHTRKVPILDGKGQPVYLLGISEDITESRQAEIDRQKIEVRFQALFNSAADMIFVIDPEGRILKTNRYACEHSGYEEHEIVGSNVKKYFTRDSQDVCDCNFPGLREQGYNRADIEFVCKDGRIIQVECIATGVPDEDGSFTSFLIVQRDVTDKKRAQEERQRQQEEMAHVMRLSTMGEMASGMAHELNQPLTALVSYCATALKLARDIPSLPEGYLDILNRASAQAHRAGGIIHHLREFVSKGGSNKTRVVLDDLIHGVIDFIGWELRGSGIQVEFQTDTIAHEACVDKVQIEQVLVNLIRNSIEAIQGAGMSGGRVDIATRLTAEGSTEVTVADNGPGIDPSMSRSLFEPYQTSKETGMGMGLTISRSIIEAHNGTLRADQQRQQGALFCISLPGCD
jgi:PAS domain S-box-containing protein